VNTRLGCETLCTTNKIVVPEKAAPVVPHIHGVSVVDRD